MARGPGSRWMSPRRLAMDWPGRGTRADLPRCGREHTLPPIARIDDFNNQAAPAVRN